MQNAVCEREQGKEEEENCFAFYRSNGTIQVELLGIN